METAIRHVGVSHVWRVSVDSPMVYLVAILGLLAASTLYISRLVSSKQNTFPPWAVIEIALASLIVNRGGLIYRVYSTIRRYGGSLFGITSKHQVLVNLPGVDRFMAQSYHTLNAEPIQYTLFTRVFGATDSAQLKTKLEVSWKELLKPIEDMFLNDTAAIAALQKASIAEKANSFVSFSTHKPSMQRWEWSADIRLLTTAKAPPAIAANLQSLARDFGACVAIPLLYGQDFLDRYTGLLDDFWKFDNDAFPLRMIGLPTWTPLKMMREGVAARARLLEQMDALYRRIDQYQNGEPVDFEADMSDISQTALDRNTVYVRKGWSFRERGGGDLAILWGQNANTQPIFFWLLAFAYSTPGLLSQLRDEVASYIQLSKSNPLCILDINFQALFGNCPRLKSCIFETYRMANEATSIRYVARPMTINDGVHKHNLQPGMFVSAPHSITQRDPDVFPEPDRFVPDRFLEADPESGRIFARYGKLRPWGAGSAICKGRTFAEKELVVLAAAIFSVWDIAPASGIWEVPTMIPGTGVKKPVEDIRVVITRRPAL